MTWHMQKILYIFDVDTIQLIPPNCTVIAVIITLFQFIMCKS